MRLGILASQRGTSLLPIIKAIECQQLKAEIATVITNKSDALVLKRAEAHGLPTHFVNPKGLSRDAYDQILSDLCQSYKVDYIVLLGYMRILSAQFVRTWEKRIINIHPSLLPAFKGLMDLEVHQAVLKAQVQKTGCTVHYVIEEVDAGPIIVQESCLVYPADDVQTLKARVQELEGKALVKALMHLHDVFRTSSV